MNIKKTIASATAAGALLANTALPLVASTQIVIEGNGAGSDNYVNYNQTSNTSVNQDNNATVKNNVDVYSNTGNNESNWNTGGNQYTQTGDASTDVTVTNVLNNNSANVDCCDQGDTDVLISGNGAFSDNTVKLNQKTNVTVDQDNRARVDNDVDVYANTGNNTGNLNTGGDTVILTGSTNTTVNLSTMANNNSANVGNDNNGGSQLSLRILDNGAASDNLIDADLRKSTRIYQDNYANVDNDVDVYANTGKNNAKFNTGGDVVIMTGDADALINVDNLLNFNSADVNCGCTWDVLAKIAGNGADVPFGHQSQSGNRILLDLRSDQYFDQDNRAYVDNDLDDIVLKTGNNNASLNTGEAGSDPAIITGNTDATVNVGNVLNSNSVNSGNPFNMPWWGGLDLDFSFDLTAIWHFLGISMS